MPHKNAISIECNTKKKFCVLQKKVPSFWPNHTVEIQPNSSAEPNVRSVTTIACFFMGMWTKKTKALLFFYFYILGVNIFLFSLVVFQIKNVSKKRLRLATAFETQFFYPVQNWKFENCTCVVQTREHALQKLSIQCAPISHFLKFIKNSAAGLIRPVLTIGDCVYYKILYINFHFTYLIFFPQVM